jgi:hypothetical protein
MPELPVSTPHDVLAFIELVRKAIRFAAGLSVDAGKIDEYVEIPYDELNQTYTYEISFNHGDDRVVEITIDLNPDEI